MRWSEISFDPPRKTLRQFAGLWVFFFGGWACWQYFAHDNVVLGAIFALVTVIGWVGLVKPAAVRYVYVGWMILAFPIGWTVSRVVLAVLFYGLFTPLALIFRLIGRDPLALRPRPEVETYWQTKPAAAGVQNYYRQY
jgi:Saxitoxin biosynthesis operon protein SxtJ